VKQLIFAFLGGGFGACTRYLITLWLTREQPSFYWATLLSNLLGCLLLGILIGIRQKAGLSSAHYVLFAVGYCGALTTFSTWIWEQQQLLELRGLALAALYVFVSWITGWLAFVLGGQLARAAF